MVMVDSEEGFPLFTALARNLFDRAGSGYAAASRESCEIKQDDEMQFILENSLYNYYQ